MLIPEVPPLPGADEQAAQHAALTAAPTWELPEVPRLSAPRQLPPPKRGVWLRSFSHEELVLLAVAVLVFLGLGLAAGLYLHALISQRQPSALALVAAPAAGGSTP